jgi:dienelactone hydrolase
MSGKISIPAELFKTAGAPSGGVVVIAHGSDGLNEPWLTLMRQFATDLAGSGLVALMPKYFASTPETKAGMDAMTAIGVQLPKWQATVADAVTHARTLAGGPSARVGLLGFSLGGHICLRLRVQAQALVSFFAPELTGIGSSAATPFAQIHHGLSDQIKFSQAESIAHVLNTEGTATELYMYPGAGHGFGSSSPADKTALDASKERTLKFFVRRLG